MPVDLKIQHHIIDELDEVKPGARSLLELCDVVEEKIRVGVGRLVTARIQQFVEAAGLCFRLASSDRFYVESQLYDVRITDHPTSLTRLQVVVLAAGTNADLGALGEPLKIALSGSGRYSAADLILDDRFAGCHDRIAAELQGHFRAGYRWLEAHVMGGLLELEHRLTIELYIEIRSVIDRPLADLVALYVVDSRGAYYMLDHQAIETAFAHAIKSRSGNDGSPLRLTALLATQLLTPTDTVAQASLSEHRSLDVPLEESRYLQSGLQIAESVFYDTMRLVAQPLVYDRPLQITAVYPRDMQGEVAPKLKLIAGRLDDVLERNADLLMRTGYGRIVHALTDKEAIDRMAEIVGRFAGGYASSLM
jgi:hypothetical protein